MNSSNERPNSNSSLGEVSGTSANGTNRVSQFVNNVNLNNIIRSNSFLHSDLGNYVNLTAETSNSASNNLPTQSNVMFEQNIPHSHHNPSQPGETNESQTFINGLNQEPPGGEPPQPNEQQVANNLVVTILKSLQTSLPFLLIILAKVFHQHLMGFFILLGFMTTLHWSNRSLVHQVELKDKKENKKLVMLILFLLLNVLVFFFIFKDYKLYNCLIFMATNISKMDTWNLIWIVACSDTIIKFLVISIKAVITILPLSKIPLRKRGSYYSTIETFALLYRSLTPIYPWILFILYSEQINNMQSLVTLEPGRKFDDSILTEQTSNGSTFFPILLCIIYSILKICQLYNLVALSVTSVKELMGDMSFGSPATLNDHDENICPICQDKLANPMILKCKHIFCCDCVCVWLDKENSCPMCRAKVSVKKPMYRDGSTTIFIQWY